ncbi:hypothetical protein [Brevifollis gellanilyticus]|uniref:Ig-like domain-containing protein n=1 Tax=Brevifollis gellanilyticus TaxID=748831 RepID=A0A512MHS7_9BACT|nr:hypothetical protein [Brevifollis gellanilyticus]GEP46293.1 hypothetical protein BGE01nite_55840 [Brevifollis gellanilyticus]
MLPRKYRLLILVLVLALAVFLAGLASGATVPGVNSASEQGWTQTLDNNDWTHLALFYPGFGRVTSSSGDWLAVAVGPGYYGLMETHRGGKVLLWKRQAGVWRLRQALYLPTYRPNSDGFASTLAMDQGRLLVGRYDIPWIHGYRLEGDRWVEDGILRPGGIESAGSNYGSPLLLAGDLAYVGAPQALIEGRKAGRVDVFQRQTSGWVQVATLKDSTPGSASFGSSLAVRGGSLYVSLAVNISLGEPVWQGRVVVLERSGLNWSPSREILPPADQATLGFGRQIQISGNRLFVKEGGHPATRVFVYAADAPPGSAQQPLGGITLPHTVSFSAHEDLLAVWDATVTPNRPLLIFQRGADESWTQQTQITPREKGLSALLSASWLGNELVLGGISGDSYNAREGRVQLLEEREGGWELQHSLAPLSYYRLSQSWPGRHLAASEAWLAAGSPSATVGTLLLFQKGSAGKFRFHSALPDPIVPAGVSLQGVGSIMALSVNRLALGLPGCVVMYEYDYLSDAWQQQAVIPAPGGHTSGGFGQSLALQNNMLVVGAPYGSRVFVYHYLENTWKLEKGLEPPTSASPGAFGHSLAIEDNRVLIGTPWSSPGGAFVFRRDGGAALLPEAWKLEASLPAPKDAGEFGRRVFLSSSRALVAWERGVETFELVKGTWTARKPVPLPPEFLGGVEIEKIGLGGESLVLGQNDWLAAYTWQKSQWVHLPEVFPRPGVYNYFHSLTVFKNQLFFRDGDNLKVIDLARPPAITVKEKVSVQNIEGTLLDLGEHLPGADVKDILTFTVTHQGTVPMTLDIQTTGQHWRDVHAPKDRFLLVPGQTERISLRFKPLDLGERRLTLSFASDVPGVPPVTYQLQARVVSQPSSLAFITTPLGGLYERSAFPGLEVRVSGTRPWSFRWFKNGQLVPGATSSSLFPKDGGRYHVEITNPSGKIRSEPVPLGLFQMLVSPDIPIVKKLGDSLRLALAVSGPGIQVRWRENEEFLSDGADISGSQTPVLTVKNLQDTRSFSAILTMPSTPEDYIQEASAYINVVALPVIYGSPDEGARLQVGVEGSMSFSLAYEGPGITPPVFRFSGLPAGLIADPSGSFYGTVRTAGAYPFQVTATVDGFTVSKTYRLLVTKTTQLPGVYWGWLPPSDDLPEAGALVLDLQPSGAWSAVLHIGATRTSLAGTVSNNEDDKLSVRPFPVRLGGRPHVCWVDAVSDGGNLGFMVLDAATPDQAGELMADLTLIHRHGTTAAPDVAGLRNFGLLNRDFGGYNELEGNGFGALRISADRRATFTGQLPDGSSITGSTWLSDPGMTSDAPARLYVYQADSKTRAVLRGTTVLNADEDDPEAFMDWQRPPTRGRLYADGVGPHAIFFASSRYTLPKNAPLLPGEAHQLTLSALNTFPDPPPFQLTKGQKALFGKGDANPLKARLDVYAPTGLFTGQFTLRDEDPANPARIITRTVQYRGIFLPDHGIAAGYFLLPTLPDPSADPPTTLATSPIVSGSVYINTLPEP